MKKSKVFCLVLALLFLASFCCSSEQYYTISETQLTTIETELKNAKTELINSNQTIESNNQTIQQLSQELKTLSKSYAKSEKNNKLWKTIAVVASSVAITDTVIILTR